MCLATTCREEAQVQARHTRLAGDPQIPEEHRAVSAQGTFRTRGEQQQQHKQQQQLLLGCVWVQHMLVSCGCS
jgi:hypothetical protein